MNVIKVLVIDDSALIRKLMTRMLDAARDIEVVGAAGDPYAAREKIKALHPDVLTLDVEMPRMDGLTFLENLMRLRPMPVVMVSSLTERNATVTLKALELGAIDFVAKPRADVSGTLEDYAGEIIGKIRAAASARLGALAHSRPARLAPGRRASLAASRERVVAIGASTGGTEAIKTVLGAMPADAPPIVITQHIPPKFSAAFAARVNDLSAMYVCEARDGQPILSGHAYIAPGDRHLMVRRDGARHVCELHDGPPVNRHRPSVDVLLSSMARNLAGNGIGVMMTGMGADGARGLLEMRRAGAATLAQDEATSVVWGMPGAACRIDAVERVLPLTDIAPAILGAFDTDKESAAPADKGVTGLPTTSRSQS
jgi:two-component system chemotaxis response regulator CheB